jgi:hypothetical protein
LKFLTENQPESDHAWPPDRPAYTGHLDLPDSINSDGLEIDAIDPPIQGFGSPRGAGTSFA